MSVSKVRKAMMGAVKDRLALLTPVPPTAWPNKKLDPANNLTWCSVHWVPSDKTPVTLGEEGEDELLGFVQVDVNIKLDSGDETSSAILEALESWFEAGRSFSYSGQEVTIRRTKRGPGRIVEPHWRESLDIYFYARIHRQPLT